MIEFILGIIFGFVVFFFVFRYESNIRNNVEKINILLKKKGSIVEPGNEDLENFIKNLPKE